MKYVPPSVHETALNCPHCGALAKQDWFTAHADQMNKDATPLIIDLAKLKEFEGRKFEHEEERDSLLSLFKTLSSGQPFLQYVERHRSVGANIHNLWISRCFNCNDISIWLFDRMIFPLSVCPKTS